MKNNKYNPESNLNFAAPKGGTYISPCKEKNCKDENCPNLQKSDEFRAKKQSIVTEEMQLRPLIIELNNMLIALGHQPDTSCSCHPSPVPVAQGELEAGNADEPKLELEKPEDWPVIISEVGEALAGLNGFFVFGLWLDSLLKVINPNIESLSSWFDPATSRLELSPFSMVIAAPFIAYMMYAAAYCHAQIEINARMKSNLIACLKFSLEKAKSGTMNTSFNVGDELIDLNKWTLLEYKDIPALSFKLKRYLDGDVGTHINEFVGLTGIPINFITKNPLIQLILLSLSIILAYFVCKPERRTCTNTLVIMEAFKNKKIINDTSACDEADCWTEFSAIAKFPAVLTANTLALQEAFLGNLPAGFTVALLISIGDIACGRIINANTQNAGESQNKIADFSKKTDVFNTDENIQNNVSVCALDNRTEWQKLSHSSKTLVVARAFGTGGERSEAVALILIGALNLGKNNQALTSGLLWIAMTGTTWSPSRNAVSHLSSQNRRFCCFQTVVPPKKMKQYGLSNVLDGANNPMGIHESLIQPNVRVNGHK